MATLLLINGAPSSGKSTVARLLAEDRPLTLVLDIDSVRGSLGRWRDDPAEAGRSARRLALAMADTHLRGGRDVIVPQFLQRAEFVDDLAATARGAGAAFIETCLVSSADEAARRFADRSRSADSNHRDAGWLQSRPDAVPVATLYDGLMRMISARPQTVRIPTETGRIEHTVQLVRAVMYP